MSTRTTRRVKRKSSTKHNFAKVTIRKVKAVNQLRRRLHL